LKTFLMLYSSLSCDSNSVACGQRTSTAIHFSTATLRFSIFDLWFCVFVLCTRSWSSPNFSCLSSDLHAQFAVNSTSNSE
jgi:hypothetical protein